MRALEAAVSQTTMGWNLETAAQPLVSGLGSSPLSLTTLPRATPATAIEEEDAAPILSPPDGLLDVYTWSNDADSSIQYDLEGAAHQPSRTQTPLHIALRARNEPVVRLLLEKGADLTKADENGLTALHIAAQCCKASLLQLILCNVTDMNMQDANGQTALFYAVRAGSEDIVRILAASHIDMNRKDVCGRTALHYVAESGSKSMAELLLECGAHVDGS